VFWRTRLVADGLDDFAAKLLDRQTKFVSARVAALPGELPKAARSVIVRDPDGHALQFIEQGGANGTDALSSKAKTE
jgi:hypothetical protein